MFAALKLRTLPAEILAGVHKSRGLDNGPPSPLIAEYFIKLKNRKSQKACNRDREKGAKSSKAE